MNDFCLLHIVLLAARQQKSLNSDSLGFVLSLWDVYLFYFFYPVLNLNDTLITCEFGAKYDISFKVVILPHVCSAMQEKDANIALPPPPQMAVRLYVR